jgi:hypothetical protein
MRNQHPATAMGAGLQQLGTSTIARKGASITMNDVPGKAQPHESSFFDGIDFADFWSGDDYSRKEYVEPYPSDELIASIEADLGGYRLPAAYIELARQHNGGVVNRSCYPMDEPTNRADDHIEIHGLYAIGRTVPHSLCGQLGSTFMEREWGYPPIGVGIADTPSAGHEQIMLDYRTCGKHGEPQVVHVDQEGDYRITFVAKDFATFIRGLVSEDVFVDPAEEREIAVFPARIRATARWCRLPATAATTAPSSRTARWWSRPCQRLLGDALGEERVGVLGHSR